MSHHECREWDGYRERMPRCEMPIAWSEHALKRWRERFAAFEGEPPTAPRRKIQMAAGNADDQTFRVRTQLGTYVCGICEDRIDIITVF